MKIKIVKYLRIPVLLVFIANYSYGQSLRHEVSVAGNIHFLTDIEYTKGTLFISEEIKNQALPGLQLEFAVYRKSESSIEPGMGLKLAYLNHHTYLVLLYPEDIQNSTSSKYSSVSKELGVSLSGYIKWKLQNFNFDLGIGYYTSLIHETNSLIKRGYDEGQEDLPDGDSEVLKGPEISPRIGYTINQINLFVGGTVHLYSESYLDPTSKNFWKGRPNSIYLGAAVKL